MDPFVISTLSCMNAGGFGHEAEEEGDGQLESGDWEHVNKTWNRN